MNNFNELLNNQYAHGIKKFLFDILKEKYARHEDIIERITKTVITSNDYTATAQMFIDVYEKAFTTAVEQHRDILEGHGIKAVITGGKVENPNAPKIFNQKNQVDN